MSTSEGKKIFMVTIASDIQKQKYKDVSPKETVNKLADILKDMQVEVVEEWAKKSNIGTYSLRLNIKGSGIGSNGKGMNEDYARASAYAEFLERYQNLKFTGNALMSTVIMNNNFEFQFFPDEKFLSAEQLIQEDNAFIQMYLKNRNLTVSDLKNSVAAFTNVQKMDFNVFQKKDSYLCIPFYSLNQEKVTYLPYFCLNSHYGSNGMCAGNTPHEALVQGLSEIIERIVLKKIVMERVKLPDIPESFLEKYPEIYKMYEATKRLKDYTVLIKDCSLGGKYQAVALVVVEKNTGRFGIKAGSHPDYAIAIERLFTEATQGTSIENFAKKTVLDFNNENVSNMINLVNGFKTSDANYPYELLAPDSEYKFVEPKDVSMLSNKDILKAMINIFKDDGYDILIHDVSYLGFPSYHILVPGLSEMNNADDRTFEAENTRFHVQKLLNRPEYIDKNNCKYVISVINYYKTSLLENSMRDLTGRLSTFNYPAKEVALDHIYFLSMCYFLMGNYIEASKAIRLIINITEKRQKKINHKYTAIYYYLSAMAVLKDHTIVIEYIKKMFDEEICKEIHDLFADPNKILVKQYPSVNLCSIQNSEEGYKKEEEREYLIFVDFIKKYKTKQAENNIDQMALRELFL